MRLALFGNGAMGKLLAARALDEGHEVARIFTSRDAAESAAWREEALRGLDAAIDFSVADAVVTNASACLRARVPLVVGTTGWNARLAEVERIVNETGGALVYGANFSIGVNLFYRVVTRAAELFQGLEDYAPFIEEAHHARKRDAPSGTALRLRYLLATTSRTAREIPISSTRAGFIPGTHRVGFDSSSDQILLTHTARNREGFAAGALTATRWIQGRRGVYEFSEMLDEMLDERTKRK
jgi:4-hydroxy-tetrahydrodipicolinate reductase